jgi:anti-repressor protein
MKDLTVFQYESSPVRTISIDNEPWFVAKDVCDILDLTRTNDALEKLDNDEKLMRKVYASGQTRDMWLVNKPGIYQLIFRSYKPEAINQKLNSLNDG